MRHVYCRQQALSGLVFLCLWAASPAMAGPSVEAAFSPEGSALALVVRTADAATSSLQLMGYSFTSPDIVSALVNARRRGVDVRVVLDEKGNRSRASRAAMNVLVNASIPVRVNSRYDIMHDKVMVVDGQTVETGSFNFTYRGLTLSGTRTHVKPFLEPMERMLALKDSSLSWNM